MATMWGAADYPIIFTGHPIAALTKAQLRQRAEAVIGQIVSVLTQGSL